MKKSLVLIGFLTVIVSCRMEKESIIWSDEFNYNGLPDSAKWGYEVGYIRNRELQYYTDKRIENAVVQNGFLMLIARKEPWEGFGYTSASINTDGRFSFQYGLVEARMKLPVGQGKWPAFWMMGINRRDIGWPRCGEIDVMEHINNTLILHGTAHWHDGKHVSSGGKIPCDVREFHVYAVNWTPDSLVWLVDGKRYYGISIKDSINSTHEFHKPFYMLLNLAIGGNWPGSPDSTTVFPDTVFVDWVRVHKIK